LEINLQDLLTKRKIKTKKNDPKKEGKSKESKKQMKDK